MSSCDSLFVIVMCPNLYFYIITCLEWISKVKLLFINFTFNTYVCLKAGTFYSNSITFHFYVFYLIFPALPQPHPLQSLSRLNNWKMERCITNFSIYCRWSATYQRSRSVTLKLPSNDSYLQGNFFRYCGLWVDEETLRTGRNCLEVVTKWNTKQTEIVGKDQGIWCSSFMSCLVCAWLLIHIFCSLPADNDKLRPDLFLVTPHPTPPHQKKARRQGNTLQIPLCTSEIAPRFFDF